MAFLVGAVVATQFHLEWRDMRCFWIDSDRKGMMCIMLGKKSMCMEVSYEVY